MDLALYFKAFILGIVEFHDEQSHTVHYVRRPFQREPDFGVTSVNYVEGNSTLAVVDSPLMPVDKAG